MSIRTRRLALAGIALVAGVALAACGDDDDGGSSAATTTAGATTTAKPSGGGDTLKLTAADFSYTPTEATAKAGEGLTIEVTNAGAITHNLSIEDLKVDVDLSAGKTETVQVAAPAAGTYSYVCKFHPGSMKGTLTVS